MSTRYTDLDKTNNGMRDFVIRRRAPILIQIGIIFLCTLIVAIGIALFSTSQSQIIITLCTLFAALCWYVIIQMQRNNDLVMTTEFQNALFASALGINNKFCIIIKRDGNIVYFDRSFQDMFPDFLKLPSRTIDALLEYGKVARPECDKIFTAIQNGVYTKVMFDIRGADGQYGRIVMSSQPILRPTGFILLRGREFIERRSEENASPVTVSAPLINRSTLNVFSHVLDSISDGIYATDSKGSLAYVNRALEQLLGYDEGEMLAKHLSLQDIFFAASDRMEAVVPDDFEGETHLHKKAGGSLKVMISQKVQREDNKITGSTALIHVQPGSFAEVKKNF